MGHVDGVDAFFVVEERADGRDVRRERRGDGPHDGRRAVLEGGHHDVERRGPAHVARAVAGYSISLLEAPAR